MTKNTLTSKPGHKIDRGTIQSNLKYLQFGIRLWTLREKRKIRSKDMAEHLGISFQEYRRYEAGELIPDQNLVTKIAQILQIDSTQLTQLKQKSINKKTDTAVPKGAKKYIYYWDLAEQQFTKDWYSHHDSEKKFEPIIKNLLKTLKKETLRIKTLPVLPLGLYLILDVVLNEQHKNIRHIREIENFIVENENFPSYVARDPLFGSFLFAAANALYFSQNPFHNLEDCLNELTFSQFSDLLFFATAPSGIHVQYDSLPALQQFIEFSSLSVLMTRELKNHLPNNLNYNHLYAAALMQSLGTYALHTTLLSHIDEKMNWEHHNPREGVEDKNLRTSLLQHLVWEFHPVISGMIAASWNFPHEVVEALIDHHKQPADTVSPVCAALKLINFFVDCDFPRILPSEIDELLAKYPQLDIKPEALTAVTKKMNQISESLLEMNSVVLENKNLTENIGHKDPEIEIIDFATDPICSKPIWNNSSSSKNEFRFDKEYSKILAIDCSEHWNTFIQQKMFPTEGESILSYGERMQNLQLGLSLALNGNLEDVSARFHMPVEDIAMRLKL